MHEFCSLLFHFLLLFLLLPRTCFFYRKNPPRRLLSIICIRPPPWGCFYNHEIRLDNLWIFIHHSARGSKLLVCAEFHYLAQNTNCYRATIVCLDAKGLGETPGDFHFGWFTLCHAQLLAELSKPRWIQAATQHSRTTVHHQADCNFKTINLLNLHEIMLFNFNSVAQLRTTDSSFLGLLSSRHSDFKTSMAEMLKHQTQDNENMYGNQSKRNLISRERNI